MRNSDAYKLECEHRGEIINKQFYDALLHGDLVRERRKQKEDNIFVKHNNSQLSLQQHEEYIYEAHPDSMDDVPATILYIFVMIFGAIFNDRILIWVAATVIFFNFKYSRWHKKEK